MKKQQTKANMQTSKPTNNKQNAYLNIFPQTLMEELCRIMWKI